MRQEPHWTDGLSTRLVNCLKQSGVETRDQALEAYLTGKLRPLKGTRNYGWKCHIELASRLGFPAPRKPYSVPAPPQIRILQQELERARQQLTLHQNTAARSYWLGVVDGLVLALSTLGVSTTPQTSP